ncbi:extracellular solute-binding protein [Ruminococcaceae bacterium OttesenSCG-928-L11]|nr:extracellular solute-binding protein [Ruminococcaceae bacterium OttesenSCG-928-L11]
MKKYLALFLAILLAAACFAGCGNTSEPAGSGSGGAATGGSSAQPASGGTAKVSGPGELPIVTDPVTLRIFTMQNTSVEDYYDNKFTHFLQDQTGITLEFDLVPEQDQIQKVNLLLASNTNLPDIFICSGGITNDIIADMADQGIFIPLDDMIEEHGYWYKQALEKDPLIDPMMKLPDGKQYSMPRVVKSLPNSTAGRMWINQVWMDNLGLKTPTTIDELADVLRAFRDNDANGNGDPTDEIPFIGASITGWNSAPDQFIMNAFVQYNRDNIYYIKDGKIESGIDKDEYRQGLIYMNMLCAEGLLDPATFTQDQTQLTQLFDNEDIALVGMAPGGGTFQWASMDEDRVREYVPLSPVAGPDGTRRAFYNPYTDYRVNEFVITSACKNPEAAFKLADFMYSREVCMRNRLGEPGVDFRIPDASEKGIDGDPASYDPILLWGSVQKSHWNEVGPAYNDFDNNGVLGDNPYELQQYLWNAMENYYLPYIPAPESVYNNLTFYTVEDARKMSDVWSTLRDYQRESVAKFATGVIDPNSDSDWQQYLAELENIGHWDRIEIMQARYDQTK